MSPRSPHVLGQQQIEDTDTNFGFIFSWPDRLFGTYNPRSRTLQWRMGLDYSNGLGFARLVIQPFIPTPLSTSALPGGRPARELSGEPWPVAVDAA